MAGRGTDIRLGGPHESEREAVAKAGGLFVIGTSRHESRRVDDQLRGRAGRQGDPGASRFFLSLEDDLIQRYGVEHLISVQHLPQRQEAPIESRLVRGEIARAQRIIENESFVMRGTLFSYSEPVEKQRMAIQRWRKEALDRQGRRDSLAERCAERWTRLRPEVGENVLCEIERRVTLATLDRCWSDYLAEVREMRDDSVLLAFAGKLPLPEFHRQVGQSFLALEDHLQDEIARTFESLAIGPQGVDWDKAGLRGPAATWTYLVGENPFGASGMLSPANRPGIGFAAAAMPLLLLAQGLALLHKRRRTSEQRGRTRS
jgi:preprotein translocase subunit SecA